jgi:hypothetical protein
MTTIETPNKLYIEIEQEHEQEQQDQNQENNLADGLEEEEYIDTEPLFTRYLYVINDVYLSLFNSIIKGGGKQEAIFWAFELYFSGFKHEVWDFLLSLYKEHFEKYNSQRFKTFLYKKYELWKENTNSHYLLADVVSNLCVYSFVINDDLQRLLADNPNKKIIYSTYKEVDVKKYETKIATSDLKHYRILRLACEYSTEKNYLGFYGIKILEKYLQIKYTREQLIKIFRYHWEYYSYNTPVWKERIQNSRGVLEHKNKRVLFSKEDFQDEFYDNYGYEPDEQNLAVLHYCCRGTNGSPYDSIP